MRYFIHLSYLGTHHHGWQIQKEVNSIQAELKDRFSKLLRQDLSIIGCGRTDAGVHSSQYFAHFTCDETLPDQMIYKLNKMLPDAITIYDIMKVERTAHAQRDAIQRQYSYFFHTVRNPFISRISTESELKDFNAADLETQLQFFVGNHDMESFCTNPHEYPTTKCRIDQLRVNEYAPCRYRITISANRFLKSMVRLIVARIFEYINGFLSLQELQDMVLHKKVNSHRKPARPQGLFLSKVTYPFLEVDAQYDIESLLKMY